MTTPGAWNSAIIEISSYFVGSVSDVALIVPVYVPKVWLNVRVNESVPLEANPTI